MAETADGSTAVDPILPTPISSFHMDHMDPCPVMSTYGPFCIHSYTIISSHTLPCPPKSFQFMSSHVLQCILPNHLMSFPKYPESAKKVPGQCYICQCHRISTNKQSPNIVKQVLVKGKASAQGFYMLYVDKLPTANDEASRFNL